MTHRMLGQLNLSQIDDFMSGKKVTNAKSYIKNISGGLTIDPVTNKFTNPITLESNAMPPSHKSRSYVDQINYAAPYKEKEDNKLINPAPEDDEFDDGASFVSGYASTMLEGLETASYAGSAATAEDAKTRDLKVYDQYDFQQQYNEHLPIAKYRDEIVNKIESNSVTIIQGSTGSGKTTQVPQYILDQYARERRWCNIIVTQPRRIAAQSIASRVCSERGWAPGSVCGFQISMEKIASPDTRILYVTTGVLLQILSAEGHLRRYSHVILDEVHERDQYTDFCLLICRKFLRQNSRQTKLVLMSATFDCSRFADYFSLPIRGRLEPAPIISVEGHIHHVDEFYVEHVTPALGKRPQLDPGDPHLSEEVKEIITKLVDHFDKLELQEQGQSSNDTENSLAAIRGTVLIFLPGFAEICAIQEALLPLSSVKKLRLLPVHSSLTLTEQIEVFRPPDGIHRKVILSTNISESSITVPDIQYVIDSCLTKNLVCDEDTNYPLLQLDWAAKASCIQRKGRAGRVARGRVYRMVTQEFYEEVLLDYVIPEMRRCPLDQLVLKAKMLGEKLSENDPPKALLALAIDPPLLDDIERTILTLKEVSALTNCVDGRPNPHDGDLTFVGRVLSRLPCDVRLGKLIIYGYVFGVLEDTVIVASALSNRSIFSNPFHDKYKAFCQRLRFSGSCMSDCFAVLNAFKLWDGYRQSGHFKRNNISEFSWCQQNYLEKRRLEEVSDMVKDIFRRLETDCSIEIPRAHHQPSRQNKYEAQFKNTLILKIVLCAAFYPNYFLRNRVDTEQAAKEMCAMDPTTTVMVRGLPSDSSVLYRSQLERIFREKLVKSRRVDGKKPRNPPEITFERAKAYIEFESDALSTSSIAPIVLEALNLRHHFPIRLDPIDSRVASQKMKLVHDELDRLRDQTSGLRSNRIKSVIGTGAPSSVRQVALPGPQRPYVQLAVRVVKDCGHFWATYADAGTEALLEEICLRVAEHMATYSQKLSPAAKPGTYCLAPYNNEYYRARLKEMEQVDQKLVGWVFFLDYGNEEPCPVDQLYVISPDLLEYPFQAIECQLAQIRPAQLARFEGGYSEAARDFFARNLLNRVVMANIYSVVNNKVRCYVSIIVRMRDNSTEEVLINSELVNKGMAENAEEGFLSQQNNQYRKQAEISGVSVDTTPLTLSVSDDGLYDVSNRTKNMQKITIHGPMSPYEVTWSGLTRASKIRCVSVERGSVNNITVDDDPYNSIDRLLVAANVNLTPARNTISLRHTTVMPPVPGLTTLVSLLFTPYAEMRSDPARTRYSGVLCGLGADADGRAIYPDHDMEITFDVVIDDQDLCNINSLRDNISIVLGGRPDGRAQFMQYARSSSQEKLRNKLIEFILRDRAPVEQYVFIRQGRWNQVHEDYIGYPYTVEEDSDERLLQLHRGIIFQSDLAEGSSRRQRSLPDSIGSGASPPAKTREHLISHLQQLRMRAGRSTTAEDIVCQLCDLKLRHPRDLMLHLHTNAHKAKEAELI